MNTPPKAPCHSCNGTGIDPTVGFLDCEFCTPAFAGVSLSAPEQPEPTCTTCNEHGEIGCLRPDGYDGERCPDCNPATVKRYHVTEAGLVEGHALGRLNVVLGADHDRVTAERDAALARLEEALVESLANQNEREVVCANYEALQQRLTAADERADVLYGTCVEQDGLLREWLNDFGRTHSALQRLKERTQAALKPAEGTDHE